MQGINTDAAAPVAYVAEERGAFTPAAAPTDPSAVWDAVASECPLRIILPLHQHGHYNHYQDVKSGKVVCLHHSAEVPDNFRLTPAQERACRQAWIEEHERRREGVSPDAETALD